MTILQQVKQLQKTIKEASKEIDCLQKQCKHTRVWVTEKSDQCYGWTESKTCADCGKSMGCGQLSPYGKVKKRRYLQKAKQ